MSPVSLPIAPVDHPHQHIGHFDSTTSRTPEKVAAQLESVFVSMMLKSMRESMSKDMFAGDGSDTFGGLFDSLMADHIAAKGGLGLADMILQSGNSSLAAATLPADVRSDMAVPTSSSSPRENAIQAYQHASE